MHIQDYLAQVVCKKEIREPLKRGIHALGLRAVILHLSLRLKKPILVHRLLSVSSVTKLARDSQEDQQPFI